MSVNSAFALASIMLALTMRMILLRANKKIAQGADIADVMKGESKTEVRGISDEERLARKGGFKYVA